MTQLNRRRFLSGGIAIAGGGALGALGLSGTADAAPGGTAGARPLHLDGREITSGWTFTAADTTTTPGDRFASAQHLTGLKPAVVPGTPLTSMIANGEYPDPLYGHIVTDTVPDTLKDTGYWYRVAFAVPRLIPGQRFWLRFDGINYLGTIWLNGTEVGTVAGAFKRSVFDVTDIIANAGGTAYLAVLVGKLDYADPPSAPSYASGVTRGGRNGGKTGITLQNGPTFFCTAGWDWLPTIPDRDLGIWQPVTWSTTGPVRLTDVRVDPTLSADLRTADVTVDLALDSAFDTAKAVVLKGSLDGHDFERTVTVPAGTSTVTLTPKDLACLRLDRPKLWWPNGYGDPYRYRFTIAVESGRQVCDERTVDFGVRRIEYTKPVTSPSGATVDGLAITVNNQPILVMGGNWGLDEALKRIPRQRLRDQVRLHRDANLNLIRNWNGQSSTEDFFEACDEYGILVWQDFFCSTEGPPPADVARDLDNIRDCIVRFRNHPSILLWCGGNEGPPPQPLIDGLDALVAELDPKRAALTSSAGDTGKDPIGGYSSGGPYHWVTPSTHFSLNDGTKWPPFHNEVGSYSIPTLEFIRKMLPEASWEHPDDFWADRDVNGNGGNGGGAGYLELTAQRYGEVLNLPDFARKSQLMNYECIKAIYEAHAANMLSAAPGKPYPRTGVIMWMTNPAQPSFVWQMYTHDLEAHSAFYAVQHACRRVNVILDRQTLDVVVANHTRAAVRGTVDVTLYALNGAAFARASLRIPGAGASDHTMIGTIAPQLNTAPDDVAFVRLSLKDSHGTELVRTFSWVENPVRPTGFASLDAAPAPAVSVVADARRGRDELDLTVKVENIGHAVALMLHLQVYDTRTGERVLPATFSDNYLNLAGGESSTVRVQLTDEQARRHPDLGVRIDGWKLDQHASRLRGHGVAVTFNQTALSTHPPAKTFGG
ncbi:glycoside hydrolase family 2 TIM barrel-domain containing protein [Amycolatopsis carbonis]|uniref:Glycoside hydrolase family 2 TIM barrel-domain containing protein n=1 Tax=Amycolatopsis carbonis TaxID=715471 RepID=A0A9Y2IBW2_9PSEU|nr:sugar-binding domain-containing protein [Amycolatopsis sp. 2-15]WIX77069.1 glycoside hydrolase family 2 TIM barrel-domain containing protein [Amycolatopsis sp. 2-15]